MNDRSRTGTKASYDEREYLLPPKESEIPGAGSLFHEEGSRRRVGESKKGLGRVGMVIEDKDIIPMNIPIEVKQLAGLIGKNACNIISIGKIEIAGSNLAPAPAPVSSVYQILSSFSVRRLENLICLACWETNNHFSTQKAAADFLGISDNTLKKYLRMREGNNGGLLSKSDG